MPMGGPIGGRRPGGGPIIPADRGTRKQPVSTQRAMHCDLMLLRAISCYPCWAAITWRRSSSAHWGWDSSSWWVLCGSSSNACACRCSCNCPSALWRHHLEKHSIVVTTWIQTPAHLDTEVAVVICVWLPAVKVHQLPWLVQQVQLEPVALALLLEHHGQQPDLHLGLQPHQPVGHEQFRSAERGWRSERPGTNTTPYRYWHFSLLSMFKFV